jgi:hypothetical protein
MMPIFGATLASVWERPSRWPTICATPLGMLKIWASLLDATRHLTA